MNKQTSGLLTLLFHHPTRCFSYDELADRFQVSSRSIRNYIQTIRSFLRDGNRESLLSVSEKGVSFLGTYSDIAFLLDNMIDDDFYLYKLSPKERIQITFLKLLLSDEPITLSQIMESFNVSRTTVLKDLEQIRPLSSHHGISFESSQKGYALCVEESQRRELILRLVHTSMNQVFFAGHSANIYLQFLYTEYSLGQYVEALSDLLLTAEKVFDFTVSDACFEQARLCLSLILLRCLKGQTIQEKEEDISSSGLFITRKTTQWLLSKIESLYGLLLPPGELDFLSRQLYGCRFYNRFSMESMQDMRLHIALTDFLRKVGAELSIPLHEDREMTAQLERHLKDITNAHYRGILFENEYTSQLLSDYEAYCQAIKKHVAILENYAGYSYSDDTISFILMYIVVAADNYFQDRYLPRVIVVCHTGICTANFLAKRLKTHFQLHINEVTSNHKLPEILDTHDFDLVISTISLGEQTFPWVKVSPILNDKDVSLLQKQLFKISMKKQKEQHFSNPKICDDNVISLFHPILRPENIRLQISCSSWQAAIRQAAKPLLSEGAITPDYVEAILLSAEKNGAYFVYCPQVALAHAGPKDGILKFGISLIRLKTPLPFGHPAHDPVTYVICLAARQDEPLLQEVIKIMDLLSRPEIRAGLDMLENPEEFLQYLIEKEREGMQNE